MMDDSQYFMQQQQFSVGELLNYLRLEVYLLPFTHTLYKIKSKFNISDQKTSLQCWTL